MSEPTGYTPRLGRRTELTNELIAEVCTYLAAGNTWEHSCALSRVSPHRALRWIEYAQTLDAEDILPTTEAERLMIDFLDGTTRARAEAAARSVQQIRAAAKSDWRAAAHSLNTILADKPGKTTLIDPELQSIFDDLCQEEAADG